MPENDQLQTDLRRIRDAIPRPTRRNYTLKLRKDRILVEFHEHVALAGGSLWMVLARLDYAVDAVHFDLNTVSVKPRSELEDTRPTAYQGP